MNTTYRVTCTDWLRGEPTHRTLSTGHTRAEAFEAARNNAAGFARAQRAGVEDRGDGVYLVSRGAFVAGLAEFVAEVDDLPVSAGAQR